MPNYNVPAITVSMPRLIRTPNTLPSPQTPCPGPPTSGQLWPRGNPPKTN